MFWRECPRSPLPPVGGSLRAHVRYLGENPMGTCVCSQERAEGSQTLTARPSGRDSITHVKLYRLAVVDLVGYS